MKNYRITEQRANIGWKETDFEGKEYKSIVQYENITELLKGEGFYDEDYDEDEGETETFRMEAAIAEEGGFMCGEYERNYLNDPEPCDSYLTYGNYFTFTEVSQEEIDKENKKKEEKKLKEQGENIKKWDKFFKDVNDFETLKNKLYNLKYPKK